MSKYTKVRYYVAGSKADRSYSGQWWSGIYKPGMGFANYLICKDEAHALRQYNRCPIKYRQIDLRIRGKKPIVWKWRNEK